MWFSRFFYDVSVRLYGLGIAVAALWNMKARQWRDGRRNQWQHIAAKMQTRNPTQALIWLHVASLGEFEQGRPLIESLKAQQPNCQILLTFFSPSGYEIRKHYPLADFIFYLPLDTRRNAARFLSLTRPDIAIFVKYEFWYHYLATLKQHGVPTLLVVAVFRKNQIFFQPYGYFFRRILTFFTHIFVQNEASAALLAKNNLSNISIAGDTRIDRVLTLAKEVQPNAAVVHWKKNARVIICGSTWQADETMLTTVFENAAFDDFKIIIAPHDIAQKNIVRIQSLVATQSCVTYSELLSNPINDAKYLIINNIGTLNSLYQYGEWAYIGGGFGRGIHNTLEPMAFGLPVVFGPKYQKFEEANQAIALGGAFSVGDVRACLSIFLQLRDTTFRENATAQVQQLLHTNQGATEQILHFLQSLPVQTGHALSYLTDDISD